MAQAKMVMQAIKLKYAVKRLEKAKVNAIRQLAGLPPLRPWYENCYINGMHCLKQTLLQAFCPCVIRLRRKKLKFCCCKPTSCFAMTFTLGTYHNDVLKSITGFFGGTLLAFIIYLIMALQLEFNMKLSVFLGCVLSTVFSIGMAFSDAIRCMVFLTLPNFFSSKGRQFLLMYAMILVMGHPVRNFTNNIMVMSESATCGQSMAMNETRSLIQAASSPVASIINGLQEMLRSISRFANAMRKAFMAMKRAITEICAAIARIFSWLKGITKICNKNMGKPYRKCKTAFDNASRDCKNKLGIFAFVCNIVDLVKNVCHIARIGELLCIVIEAVANFVASSIGAPVNKAIKNIYRMFYFNVTLTYHYNLTMEQSKSYSDVKKEIMNDIKSKLSGINGVIGFADTMLMFTCTLVFIRAFLYRHKYLRNDKFDNIFISDTLHFIDEKRKEKGMETIFPLTGKENGKYLETFSLRLARNERKKMLKGIIFLAFSAAHAYFYIVCDYSLYWILKLIAKHLEVKTNPDVPPHLKLHVQGEGAMSDMFRALISLLDPVSAQRLSVDTTPCLPNPSTPNYKVYKTVLCIFLTCLFMSIFESYALRLRHVIAGCYYPKRSQARAVYLYNRILKMRGKFCVVVRRQVRRKYQKDKEIHKISIKARIAAQCPRLGKVMKFFGYERKTCLSCGMEGKLNDYENYQHCESPGCDAVYCLECFSDLNNMCTVCMNPIDYGDDSDASEERDSSEDDYFILEMQERARQRKQKLKEIQDKKRKSHIMLAFRGLAGISADATPSEILKMDKTVGSLGTSGDTSDENNESVSIDVGGSGSSENDASSDSDSDHFDYAYQDRRMPRTMETDESQNNRNRWYRNQHTKKIEKVSMDVFEFSDSDGVSFSDFSSEEN